MFIDRNALIDISREIKNLAPILGKDNSERLEKAYLLGDDETRKRILAVIDALKAAVLSDEEMKDALLLEPPKSSVSGADGLHIGTVLYGRKRLYPFNLDKKALLTHVGVFGSSGYGKTNLVHHLIEGLARDNIPVVIFDFSKRNYRDLASMPEFKGRMKIYSLARNVSPYQFNPLLPPEGVPISEWAKEFAEVFDHAYWLLGGGRHVILKALGEIYDKAEKTPRIRDLKLWATAFAENKNISVRERNWVSTAQRPLESLCFSGTKYIFETDKGVQPSEFFRGNDITVLELDALASSDRTFMIEVMLQWIRDWMLVSGSREKLKGVIILEEAHHMVNREKSKKLGTETVVDLIFREIRELGIGIIFTDQHPSLISFPALGNTSTQIYMNLGLDAQYASDIRDASNMLGLDYDREGKYLRKLPVGHGILLCRRLEFTDPFVVEFPLVSIKKGAVTDAMVQEMMGSSQNQEEAPVPPPKETQIPAPDSAPPKPHEFSLENRQWEILGAVGRGLGSSASEISRAVSISGTAFREFSKGLIEGGYLGTRNAKVSRQETVLFHLTEKGRQAFISVFREERFPKKEEINMDEILHHFIMRGFGVVHKNNVIVLSKGEKTERVNVVSDPAADIFDFVIDGAAHLVFSSVSVKNACVQRFAETTEGNAVLYAILPQELAGGKDFKRIEF